MNLNDIIQAAQGGQGVNNLGEPVRPYAGAGAGGDSGDDPGVLHRPSGRRAKPVQPRRHPVRTGERRASGLVHRSEPGGRGERPRRRRPRPNLRLARDHFADHPARRAGVRRQRADHPADDAGGRLDADGRPCPFHEFAGLRRDSRRARERRHGAQPGAPPRRPRPAACSAASSARCSAGFSAAPNSPARRSRRRCKPGSTR